MSFARANGRMKVMPPSEHVNSKTGEKFTSSSCAFLHPVKKDAQGRQLATFVAFSQNLGELTPAEISAMKEELQVVQNENGSLILCKVGEAGEAWADVDLGI